MLQVDLLVQQAAQITNSGFMNRKKIALYFAICVVGYFFIYKFHGRKHEIGRPPVAVIIEQAVSRDVPLYIDSIGSCCAFESVNIVPQVTGKIVAVHFKQGDTVKVGTPLFSIDQRPYEAALEMARAQLAIATSQLNIDSSKLDRSRALLPQNYISKQDFEALESVVACDKASVDSAKGQLLKASVDYDHCTIVSPIDGVTGKYKIDVGNVVSASAATEAMVTVKNIDKLFVDFVVSENNFSDLKKYFAESNGKLDVQIEAMSDSSINSTATIDFLDNSIRKNAGSINLRAVLDNREHKFWPGESVRVKLLLCMQKNSVLVSIEAVKLSQKGYYVFVVKDGNVAELRMVDAGQRYDDMIMINSGIAAGETVVKRGQLMLAPGSKVVPTSEQPNNIYNDKVNADKASVSKNPTTN